MSIHLVSSEDEDPRYICEWCECEVSELMSVDDPTNSSNYYAENWYDMTYISVCEDCHERLTS